MYSTCALPSCTNYNGGLAPEAARELIKDEIKRVIRTKLDEHPELRAEIK